MASDATTENGESMLKKQLDKSGAEKDFRNLWVVFFSNFAFSILKKSSFFLYLVPKNGSEIFQFPKIL